MCQKKNVNFASTCIFISLNNISFPSYTSDVFDIHVYNSHIDLKGLNFMKDMNVLITEL